MNDGNVWSKTMTMEIDGSIDGAMPEIMFMIDSKERREKIIAKINEIHTNMCTRADEASAAA
jgi:hypothetical protein